MDLAGAPQQVVAPGPISPHSQPVAALANLDPVMDDAAVRAAIVAAESQGIDPMELPLEAAIQSVTPQAPAPAPVAQPVPQMPMEVPPKFLTPDGVVDVEKIKTSTTQLDEAILKKEEALAKAKSVEDYMRDYKDKENKFRNLPNLDRLAAQTPPPSMAPLPQQPDQMSTQQLEALIRNDYQVDPVMTTTRLIDIAIQKALEPVKAREQDDVIRKNVESLATQDGRVLHPQVFAAITTKLKETPELWRLPNPHRAAWLEVKEEMRLGEPSRAPAQPSRPLSPVLGGGTPPSTPSQTSVTPQTVISNLDRLNLKDKSQEEMGDAAIRAILAGGRGF